MEIRQLQYFLEVYKHKSFVNAAGSCVMTPQGIASSINRLEDELGFKLFIRSKTGFVLTKYGEFLLPHAMRIVEEEHICHDYFERERRGRCLVNAVFVRGTMEDIVYPSVSEFRDSHPDYSLRINVTSDLQCEEAVLSGDCDLALCAGPVTDKQLDSLLVLSGKNVLAVNESHPFSTWKQLSISDLKGIPVAVENENTRSTQILIRLCRENGFELSVETCVNDTKLTAYLAETGQCCGIINSSSGAKECSKNVRLIPFNTPEMNWDIYLIKKRDAIWGAEITAFEHALLKNAAKACLKWHLDDID